GVHERAKSRPIRETGPPAPSTTQNTASCQKGRAVLKDSRTIHAIAVAHAEPSTIQLRRNGWRPVSTPVTGPEAIADNVSATSSAEAPAALCPWAATKNGTPHSSVMTLAEKGVRKWLQNPRRVPATAVAARRVIQSRSGGSSGGHSLTDGMASHSAATTAATRPTTASAPNAGVQPTSWRTHATGTAVASWPACPTKPVACVRTGTRRAGNHAAMSRVAEMNTGASPAPSRTRAASASAKLSEGHGGLAEGHEERTDDHDAHRAEPVEEVPRGDLHRRVHGDLGDRQEREPRPVRLETVEGLAPRSPRAPCGARVR